ncbi:MAG: OmpH family outer membrane protein [Candidatus Aminicenantes bacterium]|nr:OmpH family outer membrane protein [Candidatus Aminicenantes bacterium]
MKKTVIVAMTILVFIGMSSYAFSQAKIGIINAQKLVEGTKRGRQISSKLENIGKTKQGRLESMQAEIKKLEKDLMSPALNQETKEKKALEMQNRKTALKRFVEDTQREMQILTQKEMQKLQEEIKPIIRQIGKEKGLTIVLEITAVAYFDPTVDITNEIIKVMDSK